MRGLPGCIWVVLFIFRALTFDVFLCGACKLMAVDHKLLSSTNPQIQKGDGEDIVLQYIEAMPDWKHEVGRKAHRLVKLVYPEAGMAVRWNTPFYLKDDGAFFAYYCYKKYVQLNFFQSAKLTPIPPKASTVGNVRYFHVFEQGEIDEGIIQSWLEQSLALPGEKLW